MPVDNCLDSCVQQKAPPPIFFNQTELFWENVLLIVAQDLCVPFGLPFWEEKIIFIEKIDNHFVGKSHSRFFSRKNVSKLEISTCSVWPDVEIKSSPKFSKSCQKSNHNSFYMKSDVFKTPKPHIWATFKRKFDTKILQKSPNLDTLRGIFFLENFKAYLYLCQRLNPSSAWP